MRAATDIQAVLRGTLYRNRLEVMNSAATELSKVARGKRARARVKTHVEQLRMMKHLGIWGRWFAKVQARLLGNEERAEVQCKKIDDISRYVLRFAQYCLNQKHVDAAARGKTCRLPTSTSLHFTFRCLPMTFHVMWVLAKHIRPFMAPMDDFGQEQILDLTFAVCANLEIIELAYTQPIQLWSIDSAWRVMAVYKKIIARTILVHLWGMRGSKKSKDLTAFVRFINYYLGALAKKIESGDGALVPPAALWTGRTYPFRKYYDVDEYINERLQWDVDEVFGTDHTDVDGVNNLIAHEFKRRKNMHKKMAKAKDQPKLDLDCSDSDSSDGDA